MLSVALPPYSPQAQHSSRFPPAVLAHGNWDLWRITRQKRHPTRPKWQLLMEKIRLISWYGTYIPLFTRFHTCQVVVWDFWTINSRKIHPNWDFLPGFFLLDQSWRNQRGNVSQSVKFHEIYGKKTCYLLSSVVVLLQALYNNLLFLFCFFFERFPNPS